MIWVQCKNIVSVLKINEDIAPERVKKGIENFFTSKEALHINVLYLQENLGESVHKFLCIGQTIKRIGYLYGA
jgi:hypothetical protein